MADRQLADLIITVARLRYPRLRLLPRPLLRLAVRPKVQKVRRQVTAYATVFAIVAAGVAVR